MSDIEEFTAKKYYDYAFTFNNYTEEDVQKIIDYQSDKRRYLSIGREVGQCGTPHLQGYIYFNNQRSWSALKKLKIFGHIKPRYRASTPAAASAYTKKENNFVEYGVLPVKGKKQIEELVELVQNGATEKECWEEAPTLMLRNYRGVQRMIEVLGEQKVNKKYDLQNFTCEPITDWSKTRIIVGPAGCGKTNYAKAHFKKPLLVSHLDQLSKFDEKTYDGIIFDDIDLRARPRSGKIHLFDQDDPRAIHIRYGVANIPPNTRKIFTTNNLEEVLDPGDQAQTRRCEITRFDFGYWK